MNLSPRTIDFLDRIRERCEENAFSCQDANDDESAETWLSLEDQITDILERRTVESLRDQPPVLREVYGTLSRLESVYPEVSPAELREMRAVTVDLVKAGWYDRHDPSAVSTGRKLSTIIVDGVRYDYGGPLRIKVGGGNVRTKETAR